MQEFGLASKYAHSFTGTAVGKLRSLIGWSALAFMMAGIMTLIIASEFFDVHQAACWMFAILAIGACFGFVSSCRAYLRARRG